MNLWIKVSYFSCASYWSKVPRKFLWQFLYWIFTSLIVSKKSIFSILNCYLWEPLDVWEIKFMHNQNIGKGQETAGKKQNLKEYKKKTLHHQMVHFIVLSAVEGASWRFSNTMSKSIKFLQRNTMCAPPWHNYGLLNINTWGTEGFWTFHIHKYTS